MQLNQAIQKVITCPAVTFALVGAPGSGKTSATIAKLREAGRKVIRFDCANLPAEDLARLPVLSDDRQTMHFAYPATLAPTPNTAIVLDELFKASDDTINALLPLIHGKQLFGHKWPDDLIVVVTANNAEFRVGDKLQPHSLNRLVKLDIEDWSPAEALSLMLDLQFDARVTGWVESCPNALVSFDAGAADKPESESDQYFGYSPRHPRRPFCSLRSLETASHLLKAGITDAESLAGAIGTKAAKHLSLFCREGTVLVSPADILAGHAEVPSSLFDCRQAAITAVAILDKTTWEPCLAYIKRLPAEAQLVAFRLVSAKKNLGLVFSKREFNSWIATVS